MFLIEKLEVKRLEGKKLKKEKKRKEKKKVIRAFIQLSVLSKFSL